jgi:DNA-binding NtrC family response regulator
MYGSQHRREKLGTTDEAIECLERYSWPGNIRELENVIERAVLLSKNRFVDIEDLPPAVTQGRGKEVEEFKPASLKDALAEPEKQIIRQALEANHWNRQETARALEINRTTLFKKMKQHGLYDEAEKLGLS